MSKTIEITDEQYQTIQRAAAARRQTPDALLAEVIDDLRDPQTEARYYETEGWFRHLGATEEQIAEAKRIVRERSG